jgi:hypothetical protein
MNAAGIKMQEGLTLDIHKLAGREVRRRDLGLGGQEGVARHPELGKVAFVAHVGSCKVANLPATHPTHVRFAFKGHHKYYQ